MYRMQQRLSIIVLGVLCLTASGMARDAAGQGSRISGAHPAYTPEYCAAVHNVGNLTLTVNNNGALGINYGHSSWDCFTGEALISCEYPTGSQTTYLYGGALWIGAVIGNDTLVSTAADGWSVQGREWNPDELPSGEMVFRSTLDPSAPEYAGAVSEQDYIGVFTDTCWHCIGADPDEVDGRPHLPLPLRVMQSSYAWSDIELEDFIIVDYQIENIGTQRLNSVYVGFYVDGDVGATAFLNTFDLYRDDLAGFRRYLPNTLIPAACGADSTEVRLAYISDNDGDLTGDVPISVPAVTGMCFLQTPWDSGLSFNWWVSNANSQYDYGPMTYNRVRDFGTGGTGTPPGDRNKYFMLSNRESDFDQVYTASIGQDDTLWMPPNVLLEDALSVGYDARYLLSGGPFDMEPGESRPMTLVYVAGSDFHTNPANLDNLPQNPNAYSANLDFNDLSTNLHWARRVFDIPGFDSDSDGYAGESIVCGNDTVWMTGDGVSDMRAGAPPPGPEFRIELLNHNVLVQWNDWHSQQFAEPLTRRKDFEGCAVYYAVRQEYASPDWIRAASWDVEDFHKYVWDASAGDWRLEKRRFMLEELLCLYAPAGCSDREWHPLQCPRQRPLIMRNHRDSVFYFEQIGANTTDFGHETPIRKLFPNAPKPLWNDPSDVPPDSAERYLTDEGRFKYHEYTLTLQNLLPGVGYYVTVTAFDHGAFAPNARFLESPKQADSVLIPDGSFCASAVPGNINGDPNNLVDLSDLVDFIDFLFQSHSMVICRQAADLDCSADGPPDPSDLSMRDLTILIDHLYISGSPLVRCD